MKSVQDSGRYKSGMELQNVGMYFGEDELLRIEEKGYIELRGRSTWVLTRKGRNTLSAHFPMPKILNSGVVIRKRQ